MKRIFTFFAFIGFALTCSAQRHADIAITGISFPAYKSTIKSDNNFSIAFNLKNNGPDSVKITDSIFLYLGSNGVVDTTLARLEIFLTIIPPDSVITLLGPSGGPLVDASMHWSGYASDSFKSFCVMARLHSAAIDPAVDPTFANNTNCADSVYMLDVRNYLSESKAIVNVYPNPAKSVADFSLQTPQEATITIKLFDILGRNVVTYNMGKVSAGQHTLPISTENLQNGIYLYQVLIDGTMLTGRVHIVK